MKSVDLALIIACVFMVSIGYGDGKNENIVITEVNRRIDHDSYYIYNGSHHNCLDDFTFMVEEKKCLKNDHKDLFNGKLHMHKNVLHNIIMNCIKLI